METNIIRRENQYQGLKDFAVVVDETTFQSTYFNVVELPEVIPQGKSSFLIGGSELLKSGVELKIEILDAQGQSVYTEPVLNYTEGVFSRVSIEIYANTAPGDAHLYFLGQLDPTKVDVEIPPEFLDSYNVRWTRPLFIDSVSPNTQPIFFYNQPTLTIQESVKAYIIQEPTATVVVTGSLGAGSEPEPSLAGKPFKEEELKRDAITDKLKMLANSKESVKRGRGNYKRRGRAVRRSSPEVDKFVFDLKQRYVTDSKAKSDFVGGEITIASPQIDTAKFKVEPYHELLAYSSSISKVINETAIVPIDLPTVRDTRTDEVIPVPLKENVTYSLSYSAPVTQSISTTNLLSYADITLDKLRTFSGDIYRIKAYVKSDGSTSDYELLADQVIENTELLVDENSASGKDRIGYFDTQATIDGNWIIHTDFPNLVTGSLDHSSQQIIDSVVISGSVTQDTNAIIFSPTGSFDFIKDTLYTISFNAYGVGGNGKPPLMDVYVSGSAFGNSASTNFKSIPQFGQKLGVLKTDSQNLNFGKVTHTFMPDKTSIGKPIFLIKNGIFHLSDISIAATVETGFSPDFMKLKLPMPSVFSERPDKFDFLIEFYDINNNIAETVVVKEGTTFAGGNFFLSGTDNLLSGSMFMGSEMNTGIEMAGVSSGFIRSIGYTGFVSASAGTGQAGFLIYSGSVLPGSGDSYQGVGLELHDGVSGSMKFRTDLGVFEVKTPSFFLGSNNQFVSGADGNIEISSSNFHLSASGDVNMSGTITATAGNIGDWKIIDGKLSGSNATLDADGAALYKTGDGPDENPSSGYYVDFTPGNYYVRFGSNFAVSSSGQLIASGAVIEGQLTASTGKIANWNINQDALWKLSNTKYVGMSSIGDTRFFAGATALNTSGSGIFNVKEDG